MKVRSGSEGEARDHGGVGDEDDGDAGFDMK